MLSDAYKSTDALVMAEKILDIMDFLNFLRGYPVKGKNLAQY